MKIGVARLAPLMIGVLAVAALYCTPSVATAQDTKIQGIVTGRNGAEMTVLSQTGESVVIVLGEDTNVEMKQGMAGVRKKHAAVMALVPGLKVDVHGTGDPKRLTATSVTFSAKDLETAQAIQAGLSPTQQQLQGTNQQVAANQKAATANQQAVAKVSADEASLNKRFGELSDYDVKHEASVFFGPGQTALTSESKASSPRWRSRRSRCPGT